MKYRKSVDDCLTFYKEILETDDNNSNDMSVAEWLDRLNLSKYAPIF